MRTNRFKCVPFEYCIIMNMQRGETNHPTMKEYSGYETKLHLMVRLYFRCPGECGVIFHCYNSQVYSDSEWK